MHGQLAREFAETALPLHHQTEVKEIFDTVLALLASKVGCGHAGLVLRHGETLESVQATDWAVDQADRLQVELHQGPCWSCLERASHPAAVLIDDTTTEDRWPAWRPQATELGFRSVMSARLDTIDTTIGFLTLYDDSPNRFTEQAATTAHVVALQAAAALARTTSTHAGDQ